MGGYEDEGEGLEGRGGDIAGGRVEVGTQGVDKGVDEDGAEVLDHEDGAPGDLGP